MEQALHEGSLGDPRQTALEFFKADPEETRSKLADRVSDIVKALHEGNHIAYGIPRKTFDEYEKLPVGAFRHQ